eukprot:1138687-Pelagomonas_calceolata.AAC.8
MQASMKGQVAQQVAGTQGRMACPRPAFMGTPASLPARNSLRATGRRVARQSARGTGYPTAVSSGAVSQDALGCPCLLACDEGGGDGASPFLISTCEFAAWVWAAPPANLNGLFVEIVWGPGLHSRASEGMVCKGIRGAALP